MDDDILEFEAELRRLRPAEPSPELVQRIARDLAPRARQPSGRGLPWYWALVFPAVAASLATLIGVVAPRLESTAADSAGRMAAIEPGNGGALKPIRVENVLVDANDEGLVTLADGTQARRERLQFVDTFVWKNARTNASLTWSMPREEVRVVPIVFQ